jgi:hypothetical protein
MCCCDVEACVCGEDLWWWGNACWLAHVLTHQPPAANVTAARQSRLQAKVSPLEIILWQHETQHGGRSGPNSKSMVPMEDEALSMAQEVACW